MRNENADLPRKFSCQYVLQTNSIAQNTENDFASCMCNSINYIFSSFPYIGIIVTKQAILIFRQFKHINLDFISPMYLFFNSDS